MYKLVFFVPLDSAEQVKEGLFTVGAGKLGNYEKCCFETEGVGQFLPLEASNPTLGAPGQLERVSELRVEMICNPLKIQEAVKALKRIHPYEEVAYEVYKLESY